jgi:hypothetical protein
MHESGLITTFGAYSPIRHIPYNVAERSEGVAYKDLVFEFRRGGVGDEMLEI